MNLLTAQDYPGCFKPGLTKRDAFWICPMCKGRGCDYCTKGRM